MTILSGKEYAAQYDEKLAQQVADLKKSGKNPFFCVINVGDDPASEIYVRTKARKAEKLGIDHQMYHLPGSASETEIIDLIHQLNDDPKVTAYLVQLPLPDGIDEKKVLAEIDPNKDADGLTLENIGSLWQGDHFVEPATANGIVNLLRDKQIEIDGKHCVIIGRSNIVGKPLAALMLEENATVTILHSHTKNLPELTKQADILVAALGQANFVTADMVKEGAVVIDVGINRVGKKLYGDVDFESVSPKASYITPVPGGVGPITVEFLMEAVVKLTRRQDG
ncbi:MAG: tetrahydrofolate dehydrogenase/cyclohydrolase catalytic domain-containing protein [Lactobacillus sp.]|nr:tetrahydrofolate dehydrogenase/cyclohydrolase catalytic domain-containing protein [Lactobacillus sp.]